MVDRFFSFFGKLIFVVGVVGVVAYGGFLYGQKLEQPSQPNQTERSAEEALSGVPTATPQPVASPSAQTIQAGLAADAGLSFRAYTITVPIDWTVKQNQDPTVPVDELTVGKTGYELRIFQAATGGAMCLYPGSPAFEGPSSSYDTFVAITTGDGTVLRRSGTNAVGPTGKRGFTACQRAPDGTFQQPTPYGHIQLTTPSTPDAAALAEMDAMIASIASR